MDSEQSTTADTPAALTRTRTWRVHLFVSVAVLVVTATVTVEFVAPDVGIAGHAGTNVLPFDLVLIVVSGLGLALASRWLSRRVLAQGSLSQRRGTVSTLRAQALFEWLAHGFAPALVASLSAEGHTGRRAVGIVVLVCMLTAGRLMTGRQYPLHITHVARVFFAGVVPALGVLLSLALGLAMKPPIAVTSMLAPLVGAWAVTFLGEWLEERLDLARPVRIAVIGRPGLSLAFAQEIAATGVRGYEVVGYFVEQRVRFPRREAPIYLGTVDDVRAAVVEHQIDLLVVDPKGSRLTLFGKLADECLDLPIRMMEASALYEELHGRVPIGAINAAWFQHLMHPRFRPSPKSAKRAVDLTIGGVVALATLPLLGFLALLIKLEDRGPVFFSQRRVGLNGRIFHIRKLRSMREDAEVEWGPTWSVENDPRTTRIGKLLRKSHLDELPQIFNVLRGEMSLVGPRPERPEFVAELERRVPYYARRHLVRPGVTGWAQVHCGYSGSDAGTAFKLSHDLYYLKHRTTLFDLLIIVETLRTLVADAQYNQFTFSEAFIHKAADTDEPPAETPYYDVLADAAELADLTDATTSVH